MSLYHTFSILIVVSAVFAYLNFRYLKLPPSIGLMLIALIASLGLVIVGNLYPSILGDVTVLLERFDFSELLLGSMLSFMLFAGAIHINIEDLRKEKISVIMFSTFSVVISTFLIGAISFYLLPFFGLQVPFIHCLLFGSLISPTDPIAVLGILKETNIPKSLETKIAGESLFNDGVAVVIFITIWEAARSPELPGFMEISELFLREAVGGMLLGLIVGFIGYRMMRSIDNYKVEVLITLAIVMGGYTLASWLHVSGPLAMVVAGILVGNHGKKFAMSDKTREYVSKFWELIDDILNAILFVLIGLELLIINDIKDYVWIGITMILLILMIRYVSVLIPSLMIKFREKFHHKTVLVLTWGGLRGGISIALALSLTPDLNKELWVSVTYFVVAFSILLQGLTVGKFTKYLKFS
ncbi:MAG: sodium:proton antiporter [Bacteroidetes bacterium]|nr:sodium:proton antiporter [Bacteroidota bacterium]MBU1374046.1 sodium:proton antiporter [Bacteroidota bacterium]MBU1484614.1 sodium:proton antiporter [Bacteroidota bacterium]MBU1761401.1 sodium:proton antiporter [Bacteroidota bacterium]MBU2045309.1 sodium:proton antiporter [Bacteroidota bacterium]